MTIELGISTFGETTLLESTGKAISHDQRIRELVEEIDEGCEIAALLIGAVHTVVDCDKANIRIREGDFCVETYFEVISAQSAHILDNDCADFSFLDHSYKS